MRRLLLPIIAIVLLIAAARPARADGSGILLLAHGGSGAWNAQVETLATLIDPVRPVEIAFGMANRASIQAAVDRLTARGVSEIVAVPLFVSSHSSIVTSTAYLLGLRPTAPPELAVFARMRHGAADDHAAHGVDQPAADPLARVVSRVPIVRMTPALDTHPIVAEILVTRARALSRSPRDEAVVLVAHGPVSDAENRRWLADMHGHAAAIGRALRGASVDALTVRDDAPAPIRAAAAEELRRVVASRVAQGRRVIVVPLLVSFGGIEAGIAARLQGLPYSMAPAGLLPDARLAQWILTMAAPQPERAR